MRSLWFNGAVWLVLFGLYLVWAGTLEAVECLSAAVGATLAVSLGQLTSINGIRHFGGTPPLKAILRPLGALLPDFVVVGRELVSIAGPVRGGFVHQPFDSGGPDDRSAMRRAATIIGVSLAPRTFVVQGEDSDELLLHCLTKKPPSPDHVWPA